MSLDLDTSAPESASAYGEDPSLSNDGGQVDASAGELGNEPVADEVVEQVDDDQQPEEAVEQVDAAFAALVDEAKHKGIPAHLAESLGENLQEYLAVMDQQAAAMMRGQLAAELGSEPADRREPQRTVEQTQAPAAPILPFKKLEFKFDPEVHDEEIIGAFKQVSEQNSQLQELLGALAQVALTTNGTVEKFQQEAQQQTVSSDARAWDDVFASLPDEYSDLYGKEPLHKYPKHSVQERERNALRDEALVLRAVDERANRPVQTEKEYARRALAYLKSEKGAAVERNKVNTKIQASRKAAIQRPGGSNGKPMTPRQKALATLKRLTTT